jgi:hypothetical protein
MMKREQIEEVVKEALSDYQAGANIDRIKRALDRLGKTNKKQPPPIPGDDDDLSSQGDSEDDRVFDPEEVGAETEEEKENRKKIERIFHAISFTGGSAADFRNIVKREVRKSFDRAGRQFVKSQSLKQVYDAVEKAVTTNLEKAVTQQMKPELYMDLKEAMVYEITHQIKEECGDFGPKKKVRIRIKK